MKKDKETYIGTVFSIITVVYNGEKVIENTVKSVVNQTYQNIEFLIIDGGSTDRTTDIISKYKDNIDYWISESDNGIYDAMNKGIEKATGDWLIFMNAGDRFNTNEILEYMISEVSDEVSVIYGNVFYEYSTGRILKKALDIDYLDRGMIACHQSIFFNKNKIDNFIYDTKYLIAADYKLLYSIYKNGKVIKKIDIPIASVDAGGVSNQKTFIVYKEYLNIISEVDAIKIRMDIYNVTRLLYSFFRDIFYKIIPNFLKRIIINRKLKRV